VRSALKPTGKDMRSLLLVFLLLLGFSLSVLIRLIVGGIGAAHSPWGGLLFASCLFAMAFVLKTIICFSKKSLSIGLCGALVLLIPPLIYRLASSKSHTPEGNYVSWAVVVSVVALAEEYFLRGALYDAVKQWKGDRIAILIGAIAFAALHVPLYGIQIIPLDFTVGIWLGSLRYISDSPTAPAVSHLVADLVAWWC
jgi:membrane protease YdiL (CAAX protease family)